MTITIENIRHIAKLARIRLSDEELQHYHDDLSNIMKMVDELNDVSDDKTREVANIVDHQMPMREDIVSDGGIADLVVANAVKSEHGCFVVPKVIDQG